MTAAALLLLLLGREDRAFIVSPLPQQDFETLTEGFDFCIFLFTDVYQEVYQSTSHSPRQNCNYMGYRFAAIAIENGGLLSDTTLGLLDD